MHGLGETVPPDFCVWRLILIELVMGNACQIHTIDRHRVHASQQPQMRPPRWKSFTEARILVAEVKTHVSR